MTQLINRLHPSPNLSSLVAMVSQLTAGIDAETIHISDEAGNALQAIELHEETLTDGSKVYHLDLCFEGGVND